MKGKNVVLIIMAAVLLTFGLSGISYAMHDDGVARCQACHTMHNSHDGVKMSVGANPGSHLNIGSDPSSTCLNCHERYGQFGDGSNYRAGGDYYWLTKTFTWTSHGHANSSEGDSHGHNIIAADFTGLESGDATLSTAPGGTYLANQLGCNSCHEPHGNSNEVLLYGIGASAANYPGGFNFSNPAPVFLNAGRRTNVSDTDHSAYGSGMSEWCANCHTDFDNESEATGKHPAGNGGGAALGSIYAGNYNAYVATGDLTGVQATAYWEIVPFETGSTDPTTLDETSTAGPAATANVLCLTCHRAHASAFPDIGRWDFSATMIADDSHPATGDGGVTGTDVVDSYYGRTFVAEQRSLCNKCHIQD